MEEAESNLHEALERRPGDPGIEFKLGNVLADLKLYNAAAEAYRRALAVDRRHKGALFNRALALRKAMRFAEAEVAYREALALDVGNADARSGLGVVLYELERYEDALASFDTALELAPDHPAAEGTRLRRAQTLLALGRIDAGAAAFHSALSGQPDHQERIAKTAHRFYVEGMFDWSIALLNPLLGDDCDQPHVAWAFAFLAPRFERSVEAIRTARRMLDIEGLSAEKRRWLHFALARLYDHQGAYDDAFSHFAAANSLFDVAYNRTAAESLVERSVATFSGEAMARLPRAQNDSELPVFIVGMPRSGTTLVEQILASHPRIHGGGELREHPRYWFQMRTLIPYPWTFLNCRIL